MSKVKILKASPFYPAVLKRLYASKAGLHQAPYAVQYRAVMDTGFAWADFWKSNLERIGNYSVEEVIVNAEYLQKAWAKEHNVRFGRDWLLDILESQIASFQPDILFCHDFTFITPDFRAKIRRKYPFIRKFVGWNGIALHDIGRFAGIDLLLTCVPETAEYFKKHGLQSVVFPHSFESSIISRIPINGITYPVSFIGSLFLTKKGGHYDRLKFLSRLSEHFDISCWISQPSKFIQLAAIARYLLKADAYIFHHLALLPDLRKIQRLNRGEAFGHAMYSILAHSGITVNTHIDSTGASAANMRLFEATGMGTCLVTDWKDNLADYFEPDQEVIVYRTSEEAVEKIRYLLSHDDERSRIAQAGRKKTLTKHTLELRLRHFHDYLMRVL